VHHAHAEPERVAGEKPAAAGEPAGRPAGMKPLKLEKRLTAAEARKLAAADHDLCLFGVSELTADMVELLAPHRHRLTIVGPCVIDAAAAGGLAGRVGPLSVEGIAVESPELARKLLADPVRGGMSSAAAMSAEVAALACDHPNWTGDFSGLKTLSPGVAEALVAAKKWNGQLPGVTAFTAADSVAVAKALANRQGPLALPNLKKISPKTLSALIEKEDVDIPLIETLELIQEPDGSPTDDFVVPEGFQSRQNR
jgi:hypothetical protein